MIMPGTDKEQARLALGRMVQKGFGMRPDGLPLTASIGLAERFADHIESPQQLLELADKRMYLAKTSGRNRLCAEAGDELDTFTVRQERSSGRGNRVGRSRSKFSV